MTEQQLIDEQPQPAAEPFDEAARDAGAKDRIRPELVDDVAYPDPNEPRDDVAVTTLAMVMGGVFLVLIIVMVGSFIYFEHFWQGPTSMLLPLLG